MELFKPIEIGFRRLLVRLLGLFVKRGRPLPAEFDFSCRKFLFVRQDRIGDVLVSTPLLYSLKARYPNATVDFLLSSNNYFVLDNEPLVRQRWVYRKTLVSAVSILRSLRRERYDFVIDLMDNPSATSTVLSALAGGKWNVGLSKANAYVYDVVVPLLSRKDSHIVDRLARLLSVFEIDGKDLDLKIQYHVLPESQKIAEDFFETCQLSQAQVIGINISPGEGARFWGSENYRGLLRRLSEDQPDYALLVLYQPSDKAEAAAITEGILHVRLSPETGSFDQFAAFVQRLDILITPDTSAVHLAAAFSIPSVVLYVQSDKNLRIWEPYGVMSETLVTDVDDLRTISLDRVFAAVSRLIRDAHTVSRPRQDRHTQIPSS